MSKPISSLLFYSRLLSEYYVFLNHVFSLTFMCLSPDQQAKVIMSSSIVGCNVIWSHPYNIGVLNFYQYVIYVLFFQILHYFILTLTKLSSILLLHGIFYLKVINASYHEGKVSYYRILPCFQNACADLVFKAHFNLNGRWRTCFC